MGSNQRFSTFKKNTKILGDLKKTTTKQQNKTKKQNNLKVDLLTQGSLFAAVLQGRKPPHSLL